MAEKIINHMCINLADNTIEVDASNPTTQTRILLALNPTFNGREVERPIISDRLRQAILVFGTIVAEELEEDL